MCIWCPNFTKEDKVPVTKRPENLIPFANMVTFENNLHFTENTTLPTLHYKFNLL